jgi:hypothetical protein
MLIARQLKKENIVEYLLYMWQIEDLIRALNLDMDQINEKIIKPYDISAEDKKNMYEWYESLIDMMLTEGVKENGHLQINKNVIIQLNDFNTEMLHSGIDLDYNGKFYRLLPYLDQLRQKQNDPSISDIELCFNFLYGIMTLHMKQAEISEETRKIQSQVSQFLSLMNHYYFKNQEEDLFQ